MNELKPEIYVASLCDYNHGLLHGVWIEAAQDLEVIEEQVQQMLANSPAARKYGQIVEDWAIHYYEDFGEIRLSEYASLEWVSELANCLVNHGEAFAGYISYFGLEGASEEDFLEKYKGCFSTEEEFTEQEFKSQHKIPEHLKHYVDWEKMADD